MKSKYFLYTVTSIFLSLTISFAQYEGYTPKRWKNQLEIENLVLKNIDTTSFKKHLMRLTEQPHVVGSKANREVQEYMFEVMKNAGFNVKKYPYDVYLPNKPGNSLIEIITPVRDT